MADSKLKIETKKDTYHFVIKSYRNRFHVYKVKYRSLWKDESDIGDAGSLDAAVLVAKQAVEGEITKVSID